MNGRLCNLLLSRANRSFLIAVHNGREIRIFKNHFSIIRTLKILAVVAFTITSTENASLETLTVFLETRGSFTRTSFLMFVVISSLNYVLNVGTRHKFGSESILVSF